MIFDTSAVVGAVERRSPGLRAILEGAVERPAVSIVTLGELHQGIALAVDDESRARRQRSLQFAVRFELIGLTLATAEMFGRLSARLPRRVAVADRWIAACALVAGRTLVTQDRDLAEHLDRVSGDLGGLRTTYVPHT